MNQASPLRSPPLPSPPLLSSPLPSPHLWTWPLGLPGEDRRWASVKYTRSAYASVWLSWGVLKLKVWEAWEVWEVREGEQAQNRNVHIIQAFEIYA